jgi:hypothetical protein
MKGSQFAPRLKRYSVRHKPRNEMNVPRQAVEFRDQHRHAGLLGLRECRSQHGAAVECVSALAGFDFDVFCDDCEALGRGEGCDCLTLIFQSETGMTLLGS